jgi:predicted TIM-barrel fold metal-dependent hydrolase
MPIIDVHTHAFTDALAPAAIPALEQQGDLTAHYDGTIGGLVAEMDRVGIDVSIVQPVATKPSQVGPINDWMASVQSDRIVGFGAMHPDLEDPAAEMARMRGMGICGFKLHPEHQSFDPHDDRLAGIYAAAIEQNMIVFFHAGADVIHPTIHGTPESFAAVMDAWPKLTIVLAHLGGYQQWQGVAEHIVGRDVWLDTAYTPRHLADEEIVKLVRAHGPDRVLFGTDGPWTDPAVEMAHIRGLDLNAEEIEGILGLNARRLLDAHV